MLRAMLVGLDDSDYSAAAAELAIKWARQFNALVAAVGVIDQPAIHGPEAVPIGGKVLEEHREQALLDDARRKVEQFLAGFSQRCCEAGVEHRLLEDVGTPHVQILREAPRYDLVMLGAQTHFQFETEVPPGETLDRVLRSTPRPLVAVPAGQQEGSGILAAYDGSIQSARALQLLVATGLQAIGKIEVLGIDRKDDAAARQTIGPAIEYLAHHGIAASPRAVVSERPAGQVILEEVERLQPELLVTGAYGQTRLVELFAGSTTRRVLRDVTVPVFLSR